MARCPDCTKFTGIDAESDPDVTLEVDDAGNVSVSATIQNNCSECGTTLYEATLDGEVDASEVKAEDGTTLAAHMEALEALNLGDAKPEPEVEEDGSERFDNYEGSKRRPRHLYGVTVNFTVTVGDKEFSGSWSDSIQAGSMDQQF